MNPITPVEQHTVLVVDDHPLFRRGVCELFSLDPTIRVVGEAGTREEALDLAEKLSPDLIVLDLNMKGSSGVEILTTLKERDPSQRVVMKTFSPAFARGLMDIFLRIWNRKRFSIVCVSL